MRRHEVDGLRRREPGRADQIALVLALGIIDDDDHLPVADVLDGLLDRGERRDGRAHGSLPATRRSTTLPSTSASRLTSSAGSSRPRVVTASVCGINATSKPSSSKAATVSETPSTAIDPFSSQCPRTLSGASPPPPRPSPAGATERTRPPASTWPCTTWPPSWS